MEYTVQNLAQIAGVSKRTLRYYDEIGLLKPARINSSGYRIYGRDEVDMLQQILFYRELGISLKKIKSIMNSPGFDVTKALKRHKKRLLEKRKQLDMLILNVNKTIASKERNIVMNDKEKFAGFKHQLIQDNEQRYGQETRERFGDTAVDKSNAKLKNMTQEEYEEVTRLENQMFETLIDAFKTGDAESELAQKAAYLHRQWLSFYWDSYTKEAHEGLAQMYVADERFKAYYDRKQPGLAEFLRDAVVVYTDMTS